MAAYIKAMEEECERAIYSPADDGAVDLKPLDPPPPPDPPLKPLTPLPPDHQSQKPSAARKRGVSAAKLEAERLNKIIKAETEWMTDDPYLRHWAEDAQEDLYGKGVSIAETRSFPSYLLPTRDTNQINRELYDMTLRDQDYQIGGPPRPVNMNNMDWNSDVSNVQGYSEFQEARDAKAFASYVMFTERQEEIDMLRRMQVHGFLKDGVEIKYGYQAQGPQGAVAWLTNEGQEIGGRLREEYERERAVTGEFAISDCRIDKSEVGARSRAAHCGFGPRTPISRASATPTHLPMSFTCWLVLSSAEARKQLQAEADYEAYCQHQKDLAARHDSKLSADLSHIRGQLPAPQYSNYHPPRADEEYEEDPYNLNQVVAKNVAKRRGSDDSVKTAYGAGDTVPDSAYRDRPDLRPDLQEDRRPPQPSVVIPEDGSVDEDPAISPFTTTQ
jgi:hypothetical protein